MRDFQTPGRSLAYAMNGMCATSHPIAAQTAVRILQNGGNAVDAAIAAAVVLGICEPQSTGIGGDCFALINPGGSDEIVALNGSGRAPAGLDPNVLRRSGFSEIPADGVDSITIPGAVDAFCKLSEDWGRIGLEACLEPAIQYADQGVPVSPRVAFDCAASRGWLKGPAREFYLDNGNPKRVGSVFRAPRQAEVLRRVAEVGRSGFYSGEVARDMVDSLRALGGTHSMDDFAETACSYCKPIVGRYGEFQIVEHPPNGQGAAVILLLNILSKFDLAKMDPFGAERTHIETEAAKLAMDARDRIIGDPDYSVQLELMLDPDFAEALSEKIDVKRAMPNPRQSTANLYKDTVLLTVVDSERTAVSMIYSIFHSFGSGHASRRFGINFQNRGAGFNLIEGHPNEAGGKKRPLHTIIPGMLMKNGKVVMPFGVMGGQYQAVGHARFVSNIVNYGMDPQEALDGPRSFPEMGRLQLERGYGVDVKRELANRGHKLEVPYAPLGGGQAIMIDYDRNTLCGASDHRKDGCALGY